MIEKKMTPEQLESLAARTQAWLDTDIKEYRSGLALLEEWIYEDTNIRLMKHGDQSRYESTLRRYLTILKEKSGYPRLIDTPEKRDKIYVAPVPVKSVADAPGAPDKTSIAPPATPEKWNRYLKLETYIGRLPEALRREAAAIPDMMLNRGSLHEQAKRLEQAARPAAEIKPTLDNLLKQEADIQSLFDRIEAYFNTQGESEKVKPSEGENPSGNYTKEQIDRMEDAEFAIACKLKRIEANKRWLKRTDFKKEDDEKERRLQEMRDWGFDDKDLVIADGLV